MTEDRSSVDSHRKLFPNSAEDKFEMASTAAGTGQGQKYTPMSQGRGYNDTNIDGIPHTSYAPPKHSPYLYNPWKPKEAWEHNKFICAVILLNLVFTIVALILGSIALGKSGGTTMNCNCGAFQTQISQLRNDFERKEKKLNEEINTLRSSLASQFSSLQDEDRRLKASGKETEKKITTLDDKTKQKLRDLEQKINSEKTILEGKVTKLEGTIEATNNDITRIRREKDVLETKVNKLGNLESKLESQMNTYQSKIEKKVDGKLDQVTKKSEDLKRELNSQAKNLEDQAKDLKKSVRSDFDAVRNTVETKTEELKLSVNSELRENQDRIEAFQKEQKQANEDFNASIQGQLTDTKEEAKKSLYNTELFKKVQNSKLERYEQVLETVIKEVNKTQINQQASSDRTLVILKKLNDRLTRENKLTNIQDFNNIQNDAGIRDISAAISDLKAEVCIESDFREQVIRPNMITCRESSKQTGSTGCDMAIDGKTVANSRGSAWASQGRGSEREWIQLDFKKPVRILAIRILQKFDQNSAVKRIRIEFGRNFNQIRTMKEKSSSRWNVIRMLNNEVEEVESLKITILDVENNNWRNNPGFKEIQVVGCLEDEN